MAVLQTLRPGHQVIIAQDAYHGNHQILQRIGEPWGLEMVLVDATDVEAIAQKIGVDTLGYLSESGMLKVTQEDVDGFCTACFSGKYPIPVPQLLQRSKLMLEDVASHRVGAIAPVVDAPTVEAPVETTEREPLPV